MAETLARAVLALLLAGAGVACAAAGLPGGAEPAAADTTGRWVPQEGLVPPGLGTLRQDEVTLSLRSGGLLLKVTPLSETVTRLLAPDTYTRLHGLATSRAEEAARQTSRPPELFLVSFFSYQPDVTYQPEDVQLLHQGRLLRPLAILPITTGWGSQRLQQQENQSALYAYEQPIDYDQPFTVRYGGVEADAWRTIITVLRAERNRVLSRAGSAGR